MKNTKNKQAKVINIKPDQEQEGKVYGCSEIFTLDKKGRIINFCWISRIKKPLKKLKD